MRKIILLAVFYSSWLCTSSALASTTFNLKSLMQHALQHSEEIGESTVAVEIADLQKSNSFADFLPKLKLDSFHGYGGVPTGDTKDKWQSRFGLTLSETLYNDGRNYLAYQKSKLSKERANLTAQEVRAKILLGVIEAYFDYVLLNKNLEITKRNESILQKKFKNTKSNYLAGIKRKQDYLRFESEYKQASLRVKRVLQNIKLSKIKMKNLIGMPSGKTLQIETGSQTELNDILKNEITLNPENSFLFRGQRIDAKLENLDVKLQRKPVFPEISLDASARYGAEDYLYTGKKIHKHDRLDWVVGLSLNYTIWDTGKNYRSYKIAKKQFAIAELKRKNIYAGVIEKQEQLKSQYNLEKESLQLSREIFMSEKGSFSVIEKGYRNGRVAFLDFLQAVTGLAASELSYHQNIYDLKKLYARVLFEQAKLDENIKL